MRILVVSQYPIYPARHGGQKRTAAIISQYRKSHDVRHVAIFWQGSYKSSKMDNSVMIPVNSPGLQKVIEEQAELTEVLLAKGFETNARASEKLRDIILKYRPHLIHIEQPYLVSAIRNLIGAGPGPVVLHGSQNNETALKEGIYKVSLTKARLKTLMDATRALEEEAILGADINIAVSKQDMATLRSVNKRSRWWYVANGTDNNSKLAKSINKKVSKKKIVFIGSAHPPNYLGIESLMANTIYLSKQATVCIIGGVGRYLQDKYEPSHSFWVGKKVIGVVGKERLQQYIQEADVILLPIRSGGGSNLKTAEALYARKKIVATEFSFRGFEEFKHFPNVYIANTPDSFRRGVLKAIQEPEAGYSWRQRKALRKLLWARRLRPLNYIVIFTYGLYFLKRIKIVN